MLVEFSFDVVQVAAGAYAPEAYHSYIGFKVAKPALERAFRDTYGIEMKDVFFNEDLAIATYRHAVATTIPEMTKVAWSKKRDEIMKVTPGMQRKTFVFNLSPQGSTTRSSAPTTRSRTGSPDSSASSTTWCRRSVRFGRSVSRCPRPKPNACFSTSFTETREHFRAVAGCAAAPAGCACRIPISTPARPTTRGEYSLADATYDELLDKLAARGFAGIPAALRANLIAYYGAADPLPGKAAGRGKAIGEDSPPTGLAHRDADLVNRSIRPA